MSANYKNWVPNGMITALAAGTAIFGAGTAALMFADMNPTLKKTIIGTAGAGTLACGAMAAWSVYAHGKFSYDGKRQLSREIIEGVAEYVELPEGGIGLDVGCGSGALTIACAKRNPHGRMVGIDRWGKEYASFSRKLCENNSVEEGVSNTEFRQGDACGLDFPDEYFDAVTSNYVYHNITGHDKQQLLKETLRVLKKGGTFQRTICDRLADDRTLVCTYAGCDRSGCLGRDQERLRFLAVLPAICLMLLGLKAFDIGFFDWVLLCNNGFHFFSHYYPETKGVYGRYLFGYNRKTHLMHIVLSFPFAALLSWISTLI